MDVLFVLGRCRARFEDLNADVRWTSACRQLDGGNSIIFLPIGRKMQPNLAGTSIDTGDRYVLRKSSFPPERPDIFVKHFFTSFPSSINQEVLQGQAMGINMMVKMDDSLFF